MHHQYFSLFTLWHISLPRAKFQKIFSWDFLAAGNSLYLQQHQHLLMRQVINQVWQRSGAILTRYTNFQSVDWIAYHHVLLRNAARRDIFISIVWFENQAHSDDIITRSNTTGQLLQYTSRVGHFHNCMSLFWLFWKEMSHITEPYSII